MAKNWTVVTIEPNFGLLEILAAAFLNRATRIWATTFHIVDGDCSWTKFGNHPWLVFTIQYSLLRALPFPPLTQPFAFVT